MRHLLIISLVLLVTAPVHAQHLGARLQWQPEIADTDPRLQQPVTVEILGRAAVPALKLLSDATGVALTVAPENLDTVGERKLTIISKGISLKAIMVQLPEALQECHWDIDASGDEPVYVLHRNGGVDASVQREEQERRAGHDERLQQRRLDSIDDARRVLAMSAAELEELEETDIFLARAAKYPLTRKLMEAYASLPQEYTSELVETGRVEFRYDEAPPVFRRMAGAALQVQLRYLPWARVQSSPYAEEMAESEERLQHLEDQIAAGSTADVTVSIRDYSGREVAWGAMGTVESGDISVGTMLVPARSTRTRFHGNPYEWVLVETGDRIEDARTTVERSTEAWFKMRDERQWDESDWVEPSDPRLHRQVEIHVRGDEGAEYVSILELQQLVAAATGLSIISDYFTDDSAGIYPGQQLLGDSLWRDLYILGHTGSFKWRLVGDCLVFHRTDWYRRSQSELPESLIVKYRQRLARQGRFTLDDVIEFAVEIKGLSATDRRGGPSVPMDLIEAGILRSRGVSGSLLLCHSLTPDEKAKARSPEGLTLAELWAKGRRDLTDYVPLLGRRLDKAAREKLARGATFFLIESTGEENGSAYTEYTFRLVFPEDADVPERFFSTKVRLPEIARKSPQSAE